MEDYLQERALSYELQKRGPSYELQKRGPSSTNLSSSQVPPVNSSSHPLDVIDRVQRRQRHIQMYVRDSASFPHKFLGTH